MGERPTYPSTADVIEAMIEQRLETWFCALQGRIQSYNPATQRADVVVGVRNPYVDPEGSGHLLREYFPVIPNVQVLFPRMGPWFLAFSVQPGDPVQLLFNTLSHEDWAASDGRVVDVNDTRRQHLSHAVALVGVSLNQNALTHAPPDVPNADAAAGCMTLGHDSAEGTRVSIYRGGRVEVTHGADPVVKIEAGTPSGAPEPVALASLVDGIVSSLKQHIANWTPVPNDGGASLKAHIATWNPASTAATFLKAK